MRFRDFRVTQTLRSGTIVRQDFSTSARFVFFDTGHEHWQYGTHGGTLFIVLFRGKPYGLTCQHVLKDFGWHQLVVTDQRVGRQIAGLRSVAYASQPKDAAIDTDLLDIAVVQFSSNVDAAFFKDAAYVVDDNTIATSNPGDILHVAGALKALSEITESTVLPTYCRLEMIDDTVTSHDPTLRQAIGKFDRPEIESVEGLSGSPVFNLTRRALCGMVVRGSIDKHMCTLRYVDVFDIAHLLRAVHEGRSETYYRKHITTIERTAK